MRQTQELLTADENERFQFASASNVQVLETAPGLHPIDMVSVVPLKLEEEHMQTLRRKDLEVQSLTLQNKLEEKTWSQEKSLMQQELRLFKHDTFLLYVRLKWLLKHWRRGKRMEEEGEDMLEVIVPPS